MDIKWDKCFAKLGEPEPAISILVIPVKEQVYLILRGHNSHLVDQAVVELRQCEAATAHVIEYLERVKQVEVSVHTQLDL